MSGITLAAAQARLDAYMAAELAVLSGQEYQISGRRLRRADLGEIRRGIEAWEMKVKTLSSAGSRAGSRAVVLRHRI